MTGLLYLCFFCSGLSGLIYQVVWVRLFGNVFGNAVYSASLVIAVFMLGLGAGSYIVGTWADRRYAVQPGSLLRVFGLFELAIGVMGLGLAAALPHLGQLSAVVSSYSRDGNGWLVLSATSHAARVGFAIILLTPITLLMGGTLTLLIRYLVRTDLAVGSRRIAALYGINTAGAALGAFLTDFALVPAVGLRGTQWVALSFNLAAAAGALLLARRVAEFRLAGGPDQPSRFALRQSAKATVGGSPHPGSRVPIPDPGSRVPDPPSSSRSPSRCPASPPWDSRSCGSGISRCCLAGSVPSCRSCSPSSSAALLLGRSLVEYLLRRTSRPAPWWMAAQALFVASSMAGLAAADAGAIREAVASAAMNARTGAGPARALQELWFNAGPILLGAGLPALLMGLSFPLANAIIQRTEEGVGRRAGVLYLSNTVGAVCGSLATGVLLLPALGIQGSATVLAIAAALAVVPLHWAIAPRTSRAFAGSALTAGAAIALWLLLPPNHIVARTLVLPPGQVRVLSLSEDITEVIAVTEAPGAGRTLFTNGHPMSSTEPLAQRYMRALAHIPLLSMAAPPEHVLVIGFGVGNTAHAATLHPSIQRVDVVDLSRHVLNHAGYFADTNGSVLTHPRVVVHVNDGRQHLQMDRGASYDLITLEPPPIVHAGVAALYSREFYRLARGRLTPGGFLSQWLPVDQVPEATALAMIRAFLDVFPESVLVSGAQSNLLLIGTNGPSIEIDPARVEAALADAPAVRDDLQRIDLGTVREIVGTFVGSAQTMAAATRESVAVTDDRPIQEYGARSLLNFGEAAPASVIDVRQVAAWCPACFVDDRTIPPLQGLDTYLALLDRAYFATGEEVARTRGFGRWGARVLAGSAYLGATVPESAEVHAILGSALRDAGQFDEAIEEFQAALKLTPRSARVHNDLGIALAMQGKLDEAIERFEEAVETEPGFDDAQRNLATARKQRAAGSRQRAGGSGQE